MGLALGILGFWAIIGLIGILAGGLMLFFSFKLQDTQKVLAVILALLGMLFIAVGILLVGFFIAVAVSIFNYR